MQFFYFLICTWRNKNIQRKQKSASFLVLTSYQGYV